VNRARCVCPVPDAADVVALIRRRREFYKALVLKHGKLALAIEKGACARRTGMTVK
jgi:hypothetical protein